MKVRMLVHITGTRGGKSWPEVGGVVDVSESEAFDMVASGYAEPLDGEVNDSAEPQRDADDDGGPVPDPTASTKPKAKRAARKRSS